MTTFCPTCEDYRKTATADREETYKVRGREITVPVMVAVCPSCGESLGTDDDDQEVLDAVHAEYRRQLNLLDPDEIRNTRQRYRLSQRSFARLLGMSEATINRYEKGGLQDQAHDNVIRACEDAGFVRSLLRRRGHLLSKWQREQMAKALAGQVPPGIGWAEAVGMADEVSDQTGFRRFDYKRFAAVVTWLCRAMGEVSTTVINKLLFYADFLNFKTATVSLTGAAYRRLRHGPAPSDYGQLLARMEAEDLLNCSEVGYPTGYTGFSYQAGPKADSLDIEFTPHELAVLTRVAGAFRGSSAKAISERSHQEPAWQNTEDKGLISYQEAAGLSLDLPDGS